MIPESEVTSPDPADTMDALLDEGAQVPKGSGLPFYQCHKKVQAAKIKAVAANYVGSVLENATIVFESGATPVTVDAAWISRHSPSMGGYYILYADGYSSYSPAHAFEGGYTRINDPNRPVPYQSDKLVDGEQGDGVD